MPPSKTSSTSMFCGGSKDMSLALKLRTLFAVEELCMNILLLVLGEWNWNWSKFFLFSK